MAIESRNTGFAFPVQPILLGLLLAIIFLAGGASRIGAMGQPVVRGAACVAIALSLVLLRAPLRRGPLSALLLLALVAALLAAQLIPLPPGVWHALPGRAMFIDPTQPGLWRPWSLVPDGTVNALASLIVPGAILFLIALGDERGDAVSVPMLVAAIVGLAVTGALQFSGAPVGSYFVDLLPYDVSGTFENRNHFALLLAIGCLVVPFWATDAMPLRGWRALLAVALIPLFCFVILGTGSRAGLILAAVALVFALLITARRVQAAARGAPRWALPAAGVGLVALVAAVGTLGFYADRAASLDRVLQQQVKDDLRFSAWPTLRRMYESLFPAGAGGGSFEPLFRVSETRDFLNLTYFNHAHNDFFEIVLEHGAAGIALMALALLVWAAATLRAWRAPASGPAMRARLGSAVLALIALASTVDYPARTPIIMAVAALGAGWLAGARGAARPARR